jgi:transposase-like protein
MTRIHDCNTVNEVVQLLADEGFEGMAQAIQILLNEAMKLERSDALQAGPYERTDARTGYANGFKKKTVHSRMGELELQVPQTRGVEFYPSAIERGERSERALKVAIAEMYVQGVSTRKVVAITRKLCGLDITSTQVSRAAQMLDEELEAWRQRALEKVDYLLFDARYEKVRHGGSVRDCSVLVATGVTPHGSRTILGVSVSLSEAEVHWRQFMECLISRGLSAVRFIVSDDHSGLNAARKACFPGIPWQRCQCHLQRNAIAYVPKVEMRAVVASDIRKVFNAPDQHEANRQLKLTVAKYKDTAPRLSEWKDSNLRCPQFLYHEL